MMEITGKWDYSLSGETYETDHFDTRIEAINAGYEAAVDYDLDSFYVGRVARFIPKIDIAEDLIWRLQEQAGDLAGEFSEDYLENIKPNELKELNKNIEEAFYKWIDKYPKHKPHFFTIEDAEQFMVKDEYAQ